MDPSPKYCRIAKRTGEISLNEDNEDLSNNPGDENERVSWIEDDYLQVMDRCSPFPILTIIHRQEFVVKVPPLNLTPAVFDTVLTDVVEIEVSRVLRNPRVQVRRGEISNSLITAGGKQFRIHAGYHLFLLGLLREVKFVSVDKMTNEDCNFRAHYLVKVLDAFAAELMDPDREEILTSTPHMFRSTVLNPILQRQMRGVPDNLPEEVERAVGHEKFPAELFYHQEDPLVDDIRKKFPRNLLYLPSVRLSFGTLYTMCTDKAWENVHYNTETILAIRREEEAQGVWKDYTFNEVEREVIRMEKLSGMYQRLLENSVCAAIRMRYTGILTET